MRTIAIGDIHGCRASLEALADFVGLAEGDTVVTLGDYVDRGPDTRGVIAFLLELRKRLEVVALMGNHEVMMLEGTKSVEAMLRWQNPGVGGQETLASYAASSFEEIPVSHWRFLNSLAMYHETETHLFVHASLVADLPLDEQPEVTLLWERFGQAPAHESGKVMVCGHTSQRAGLPVNLGHAICIDTAACHGGWLTALDTATGSYWQTNEAGERRAGNLADLRR